MDIKASHYYKYILGKYKASYKNYITVFNKNDNPYDFLMMYENLNVYPTFPEPVIVTLKKPGETFEEEDTSLDLDKINKYKNMLDNKIREYASYLSKVIELKNRKKIRRYFDYEIRDALRKKFGTDISNAWIKMYELLVTYEFNFIKDKIDCSDTSHNKDKKNHVIINTFHICEHPGKFIFAIKDYISKQKIPLDHRFVFQSLNPRMDKDAFKVDKRLIIDKKGVLDYGKNNTGDITDMDNILYYINKYSKKKFKLITSDCGQSFKEDFTKQETGLYKIFLSAMIVAIGISSADTVYIFKMFSFNDPKTIHLLYLAAKVFKKVDIVRLMTTKGVSGENYCVCISLNTDIDREKIINKLLLHLKNSDSPLYTKMNSTFVKRVMIAIRLFTIRRIVSYNQMIFRLLNFDFVQQHEQIVDVVKKYVDYYTNYFIDYITHGRL